VVAQAHRRGWAIPAVAVVVFAAAAGAGALLREAEAAGAGGPAGGTPSVIGPAEQPGSAAVVLLEDVQAHPEAEQVRAVLQEHFDAINTRDYDSWTGTVTTERARATPRGVWREQYQSTRDGAIVVHRLEPRPGGGLVALLSFTSVQDPAQAPPDLPVPCLRWRVSYPLVGEADQLRLALSSPSASLRQPC